MATSDNSTSVTFNFEIIGLIWRPDHDDVVFSARMDGKQGIVYLELPPLLEAVRKQANEQGVSLGDICDEWNMAISERERERMRQSGMPYGEFEFHLTDEQAEAFAKVFEGGTS